MANRTDSGRWPLEPVRVLLCIAPLLLLLGLLALLVPGCGGGVDSGGTGREVSSFATGPISGFGSVVVNGVRYDDSHTSIVDAGGAALSADSLKLGAAVQIDSDQPVLVAGRLQATASRIRVGEEVLGRIDSIDLAQSRLVVIGQSVQRVGLTVLSEDLAAGLAALRVGDIVRVYGQTDPAAARIVASRIERLASVPGFSVRGAVASLDRVRRSLRINGLPVSLAGMADSALPAALADGDVVRIALDNAAVSGTYSARSVVRDALTLPDREHVQIEGRVGRVSSSTEFTVDGVTVDATGASFPNGTAGLRAGARVEVEGRASSGRLLARSVKLESDDSDDDEAIELEGTVSALDRLARTFVLRGVTVDYGQSPRFEGGTEADLAVNRKVAVKGRLSADQTRVVATRVHVEL